MANYVGIAEAMSPDDVTKFMSKHFDLQERAISASGGKICNIIGDNIMSLWDQDNSAQLACESALAQVEAMKEFGNWAKLHGFPIPTFRIGINTGMMLIGHEVNKNAPIVLGDAVNMAARLDRINDEYGTKILISEFTRADLSASLVARPVDVVMVKGRERSVTLFELVGRKAEIGADGERFLAAYEAAFTSYRESCFDDAVAAFETAQARRPDDVPTKMLMSRCREYLRDPPAKPWDGVFIYRASKGTQEIA